MAIFPDESTKAALEAAPDAVVATGFQGVIEFVNSKAENLTGYSADELEGQSIEILVPNSQRNVHSKLRSRFHENPTTRSLDVRRDLWLKQKNGILLPVAISLSPIADSPEHIVISTIRDMSSQERRTKEDVLLAEIGSAVSADHRVDSIYKVLNSSLPILLQFDRMVVSFRIPNTNLLERVYVSGQSTPEVGVGTRIPAPEVQNTAPGPFENTSLAGSPESATENGKRLAKIGLQSWIEVPLGNADEPGAILSLRSSNPNGYTEQDLLLLERVSTLVAPAFENARLYAKSQQETHERTVLTNISRIINSTSEIQTVYNLVGDEIKKLIPFDRMVVATVNHSNNILTDRYVTGTPAPGSEIGANYPIDSPLLSEILNNPKPRSLTESDLRKQASTQPVFQSRLDSGLRSVSSAPLIWDDATIGFLALWSKIPDNYTDLDAKIVARIAAQISGAVANAELVQNLQREITIREALGELSKIVSATLDIDKAIPEIVPIIQSLLPLDRLVISDIHENNRTYNLRVSWGGDDGVLTVGEPRPIKGTVTELTYKLDTATIVAPEEVTAILATSYGLPSLDPNIPLKSWIAVPLRTRSSTIGVLHIRSNKPDAYGDIDRRVVEMIGAQIASGMSAQTSYIRAMAEANERSALAEIGRVVSSDTDIKQVYEKFAVILQTIVVSDRIVISLLNEDKKTYRLEFVWGNDRLRPLERKNFDVDSAPLGYLLKSPTSVLLSSQSEQDLKHRFQTVRAAIKAGVRSLMVAPLISGSEGVLGGLHVSSANRDLYTAEDVEKLERVAAQIAGVLANHRSHARALNAERARVTVEAQKRELEVLEEQRVQFLSTVSHELKTPLTSLTAFADFLARNRESNLSDQQLEQIQAMQRSTRRLDVLIDDLLDLSKIDADRFVLTWSEFDLGDLLNELVGEFAPITQEKRQKIVTQQSASPNALCADRTRIAQVVSNVLSNATKYSPENKSVFLETESTSSHISITIRDEGIGMTPEVQEKMFTPFFRAPDATTQTEVGTGLGLVITKSIVQLHGGEISIKSDPGSGTTVEITLPNCQTNGHSHPMTM